MFNKDLTEQQQKKVGEIAKVEPTDKASLESYLSFLEEILPKINLDDVHTLYHQDVYDSLSEHQQEVVIQKMHLIMASLHQLYDLIRLGKQQTAQAEYYVESIKHYKEKLEDEMGDVLIL